MPSRDPRDLHPDLQPLYAKFQDMALKAGIDYILTCTYRSNAEQDKLFGSGRNYPGPILTNAAGGESAHNFTIDGHPAAAAFDVCVVEHGKCMWQTSHPHWGQLGNIGEFLGLVWAGHFRTMKEFPHFQLATWRKPK